MGNTIAVNVNNYKTQYFGKISLILTILILSVNYG